MVLPPNPRPKTTTPAAPASPHTEGDNLSKQGRGNARYGNAQSSGASTPASTVALQGSVSLDAAMVAEAGQVDWYRWYLSARQYLKSMGGLRCTEGTRIVFYRNGRIQALSQDPFCQISAMSKQFPLPQHTQVQAVVLPTRQSSRPPASPQELIDYVRQSSR
ncbi:MAG: hypothetical protein SFZ03_05480 [Candidatus Melainabacteria bacterium]|nr:hypothetical protein [Candidatus Melainabacteria bacterium]